MENILELRCILEEGRIVKQVMTAALILAAMEAVMVIKCIIAWPLNDK